MDIIGKIKTPNKGDVIWTFRFPYFHCGIYENKDSVFHFAPNENTLKTKSSAVIHKTSLEKFANGLPVSIIEFPNEKCFPPDEVITRARTRLSGTGYNLSFNNCDHFATWCKIGKHKSTQEDLIKKLVIAVCKAVDNSGNNETEYAKFAEIVSKIHEILEIIISINNGKAA